MHFPRGNRVIFKMYWLILMLMPLAWANGSDLRGSHVMTTVAPSSPGHRSAHKQQRLQQYQQAQQLEAHQPHHRHLRHEQHWRAELEGNHQPPISDFKMDGSKKTYFYPQPPPMQQHHLRHHNRHHLSWEQAVNNPSLLPHQPHRLAIGTKTIMTTEAPSTTHHGLITNHTRYFDRGETYLSWAEPRSTRAPNWRQELDTSDSDGDSDEDDYEYDRDSDSDIDDNNEDGKQMASYSLFNNWKEPEYDAFDQSDELEIVSHHHNKHPSVANPHVKTAGKRYIWDWFTKKDTEKVVKKPHATSTTSTTTSTTTTKRPIMRTERPGLQLIDANLRNNNGGEEEYSNEDSDSDSEYQSDEGVSVEEWNKKDHSQKFQKQKNQNELLEMRRNSRNTPLIRSSTNEDVKNTLHGNYINGRSQKREDFLRHKKYRALAHAHMNQVLKEATCRIPQKRCLLVQHDPSKIYTPHCTILHRCSEDSGCCPSRSQICAAKSTHNVELYFFVKSSRHRSDIEKRTFVNHTECHCIERSTYNEDLAMANNVQSLVLAAAERCTCPKTFEIFVKDDQCRCDCSSGNISCEWLKNGKEHFDMADRKCIKYGFCKTPTCTYGDYKKEEGGCPTDSDKQYDANGAKADKREN